MDMIGVLEAFWFFAFSFIGLAIGYRLGGEDTETVFGMEDGTAQITAHCCMVAALAFNAEAIHAYWLFLVALLPQSGTAINEITATIICGFMAILWLATPVLVAIGRDVHRNTCETKGSGFSG